MTNLPIDRTEAYPGGSSTGRGRREGTRVERATLRRALLDAAPWLGDPDRGPRSVDAGMCDRCDRFPRLLPTCGPAGHKALCRDCALAGGDAAWCDGHLEEGRAARDWADTLPARWPDLVMLWWVATGETRLASVHIRDPGGLPARVAAQLPVGVRGHRPTE